MSVTVARQFLYELFDKGAPRPALTRDQSQGVAKPELAARLNPSQPSAARESVTIKRKSITVSELARALRHQLESVFADLWVQGDISNLRQYASGHWYFTLQDAAAQIPAVMFAGDNKKLRFVVEDGAAVLARGRVSFYDKGGRAQLVVRGLEPWGAGARALALKQLREKLRAEGLFEPARKKTLPLLPRRLGVVTSADGAALHDILTVTARRFANMPVILSASRVQGQRAEQEIAQALRRLDQSGLCDVIIVGRGGGSEEDLAVFSTEVVVRAVAACTTPVVSAVGHEVDDALCDLAADLRAATPSAAAELVVPLRQALGERLALSLRRAQRPIAERLRAERYRLQSLEHALSDPAMLVYVRQQSLDTLLHRLWLAQTRRHQAARLRLRSAQQALRARTPRRRLDQHRTQLAPLPLRLVQAIEGRQMLHSKAQHNLHQRLLQAMHDRFILSKNRLAISASQLDALSPLAVLARGYAVVRFQDKVLKSGKDLSPGAEVEILLQHDRLRAQVSAVVEDDGRTNILPK